MRHIWRLLITPPAPGDWNMAVDESLLTGLQRSAMPILRLYSWSPPCLSLGRAQPFSEVDTEALQRHGWDVVRRPTGGRAILHTDELTYALIMPPDDPLALGSVLESYQRIARGLMRALEKLGAPVSVQKASKPRSDAPPVCFEVPSSYEITVQGKKLLGSAQARRREGVLQHGSLPLYGDLTRITRALRFANDEARQQAARHLREKACTLEEAAQRRISWQEAAEAFQSAMSESFGLRFYPQGLSAEERAAARALADEKYAQSQWTQRI